jgi:hypothetical protein
LRLADEYARLLGDSVYYLPESIKAARAALEAWLKS